jgi:hypothetical protein
MIAFPPNIPYNPLTLAKESQKQHKPPARPLLQRILKIDISYKFKDHTVKFHHERPG